ncbi:MAG: glycosyltransferase family 4 protein [Myxococcales bacterium]|nr:glycosyltransferase family 4 protein [Myxococcales bacterium]
MAQVLCAGGFGGAEAVACALAEALAAHGATSCLYALVEQRAAQAEALVERVQGLSVPARIIPVTRRFDPQAQAALRDALRSDRIQAAHAHAYKAAVYAGGRRRAHRALMTIHGFDQATWLGHGKHLAYTALGAAAVDRVLAVDRVTARRAARVTWRPIEVVPNATARPPAEAPARAQARAALARAHGVDPERPWIAWVGRLVPVKRPLAALAVARALPEAVVWIAGDGPLAQAVAQAAPVNAVRLGYVADLEPLYAAADVVLSTSASEGCPMTALEAMARGVPVVAPAVGGVPDVVQDGRTGLLAPPGDDDALAAHCRRLLADRLARARLGRAAADDARARFAPGPWAHRHLALYGGAG